MEISWQKGITYTHLYRPQSDLLSGRSRASLAYLRRSVKAEWIALNPFGYQHSFNSSAIHRRDDPPDAHLRHAIRQAHRFGLKVMLKPHIWLIDRAGGKWRGEIEMESEAEWKRWFDQYERFILHYARLAADEEVELLCIGTELGTTARTRERDWRRIIRATRQEFDGPLVYAANWWHEYDQIRFWDDLDYMGINAFFPISQLERPSADELRRGAEEVAQQIAAIHLQTGKPVIFTEIGFRSVRGTSVRPWEWSHSADLVDLKAQTECYEAVFSTFWSQPWLHGIYWWKWYSDLERGGKRNGGFTPQGKPAEKVLSHWYSKERPIRQDR